MKRVRVLVVDDSTTMRGLICAALNSDPEIEVVGEACDPYDARTAIKELNPDVVTLDIEMPKMNGLEFLEKIMRLRPMPVIMFSTLTSRGSQEAIAALEIGAFDCLVKPVPGDPAPFRDLAEKVRVAARARVKPLATSSTREDAKKTAGQKFEPNGKVLAIGSSTGGVEALREILLQFPANCPPTVITQHMPESFTKSFAGRLDRCCAPHIAEAVDGAPLKPGTVYLAPGGARHLEIEGKGSPRCRLRAGDLVNGHRPSVDVLFESVAKTVGAKAVGVILTGMGRDGAEGLLKMRNAGASTLGQDESTSLIYGMPKVAFERGAVQKQVRLDHMSSQILSLTGSNGV
jgi:two-component system chemotaxis response regulator CheB